MLWAESEDVTAMREEGDLPVFMRVLIGPAPTASASLPPPFRDPAHIPGAWPAPQSLAPGRVRAPGEPVYCGCLQCKVLAEHVESDVCVCSSCARHNRPHP